MSNIWVKMVINKREVEVEHGYNTGLEVLNANIRVSGFGYNAGFCNERKGRAKRIFTSAKKHPKIFSTIITLRIVLK